MTTGRIPFRHRRTRKLARASLIALWLWTAVVSVIELNGQSRELLAAAATPPAWMPALILGGALLDLVLGLAMWRWHRRWVYLAAGAAMLSMTIVGTWMLPSLWLAPLGQLSKNLPIAALLFILYEDAPA